MTVIDSDMHTIIAALRLKFAVAYRALPVEPQTVVVVVFTYSSWLPRLLVARAGSKHSVEASLRVPF